MLRYHLINNIKNYKKIINLCDNLKNKLISVARLTNIEMFLKLFSWTREFFLQKVNKRWRICI